MKDKHGFIRRTWNKNDRIAVVFIQFSRKKDKLDLIPVREDLRRLSCLK
jgi:hypothetical protein